MQIDKQTCRLKVGDEGNNKGSYDWQQQSTQNCGRCTGKESSAQAKSLQLLYLHSSAIDIQVRAHLLAAHTRAGSIWFATQESSTGRGL